MFLFECTNGLVGESYVRVYAWAESEQHAISMAKRRFNGKVSQAAVKATELFDDKSGPFVTLVSSSGFNIG